MSKVKWTKEILDEIYLLRQSHTLREIGDMYKVTPLAIRSGLRRHDYPPVTKRLKLLENITESDLSYMAGLFDGEGYIDLKRKGIVIANTNHDVIIWLINKFGGSVKMIPERGNHNTIWRWKLSTCSCRFLLRQLLPYLIIKRKQALVFVNTV